MSMVFHFSDKNVLKLCYGAVLQLHEYVKYTELYILNA